MTVYYNQGKAAKANNPLYQTGKKLSTVHTKVLVDVSELTDGDIFVLAEGLPIDARIHRIMSPEAVPALTAADDNDFGFYKKDGDGNLVALDADILVDGGDLSSSIAQGDLLRLNSSLDRTKTIAELLGVGSDSEYVGGVVLAMTMNTKATTTDQTLDLDIVIEHATTL